MNIGILTSSRADYGIYLPVLHRMKTDPDINPLIIAFGTHVKKEFGYTVNSILNDGFEVPFNLDTLLPGDHPKDISRSFGHTVSEFASFWEEHKNKFDIVLCLGDRYEMAAAVTSGIPFGIKFAHLHAGETSEGAIDNIYRDQISLVSMLHFIALPEFKSRIESLVRRKDSAIVVGALSLENIKSTPLLSTQEFYEKWNIDLTEPSILVTVHPETVEYELNYKYSAEIEKCLQHLSTQFQLILSMPNSDTLGSVYRTMFEQIAAKHDSIKLVENFGSQSYFSAMEHCKLIIGNTSSGILEAASFNKYVINIGNRQKNRICGDNVIHVPFHFEELINAVENYINKEFTSGNIYSKKDGVDTLIQTLKNTFS